MRLTRALLARASGDVQALDQAIGRYITAVAEADTSGLDLTLGASSALLGAALLYGMRPAPALRPVGDRLVASIWDKLGREPPINQGQAVGYLGIAHGWAGYIYSALLWAQATATPPAPPVLERLAELTSLAEGHASDFRVPLVVPGHPLGRGIVRSMDGWCHGQAGHVFLHLLAGRILGAPDHIATASRLGEAAFAGREDFGNLCCGLAGRAYAMLALHRATGDGKWLARAKRLAAHSTRGSVCDRWPNSLYKGRVGLAVVAAELERPELAAMPLFEDEGWP